MSPWSSSVVLLAFCSISPTVVGVGLFLELYCPKLSLGILGLAVDLATLGQSTEGREEQSSPTWSQ